MTVTATPAKKAAAKKTAAKKAAAPKKAAVDETEPTEPVKEQRVNVTAVLADVAAGEALRAAIKQMQANLKIHEDAIKDVLGDATEGVDADGKIVVRFPERNRTDLIKAKVKDRMDPAEYAECEQVTTYRTLLYGA